ncbi:hypothetical protein U6B65_00535 [Oscillospiraceae bacterium MB08-C2-2]|nr:hypothetical protein U6B65_00535 [Oscillospiraceae bacterium MB08-C2-2]
MLNKLLVKYRSFSLEVGRDFEAIIAPLMAEKALQELDHCLHHFNYTRLLHSYQVARWSYFAARLLGWNALAVARAGLLHDLFLRHPGESGFRLIFSHPKVALHNARKLCDLTPLEEDIILKHMWLMTFSLPRYKESYLVTFMDKCCAAYEFGLCIFYPTRIFGYYIRGTRKALERPPIRGYYSPLL